MNDDKTVLTKWTQEDQARQNLHLQRILDRVHVKNDVYLTPGRRSVL